MPEPWSPRYAKPAAAFWRRMISIHSSWKYSSRASRAHAKVYHAAVGQNNDQSFDSRTTGTASYCRGCKLAMFASGSDCQNCHQALEGLSPTVAPHPDPAPQPHAAIMLCLS